MKKILVVDDELIIRRLVRRMAEGPACEVVEAATASDAEMYMEEHGDSVSTALVDVSIPDINGLDLATQWTEDYPHLKIILISGMPVEPAQMVPGRMAFLQKPFSRDSLLSALA